MRTPPTPLGPESLTWRYFGDWRGLLQGLWAGSMQNMHPGLGAGVSEHSRFFSERWPRLLRSLYPIGGVVFDGDRSAQTAREVRDYHRGIHGVDASGRAYHALDPDTFYWAHSTFFMGTILAAEHFMGGITEQQKRQLFDEHKSWYAMYGMSMRPVPDTWEDFQVYWKRMCTQVLEVNDATRQVLDLSDLPKPPTWWFMPSRVWTALRPGVARFQTWITVGLYDPEIRDLLGFTWTDRDARWHRRFGRLVHASFSLLPARRRLHPRARAGWDRATGRIRPDAPLPETHPRNLPPADQLGDQSHYVPDAYRPASKRAASAP
jgi:uncharacterized protein (DUF2236 family)